MVAILGQDRSLVFGPFRFGAFEYLLCDLVLLSIFVIYFVIYQCVCVITMSMSFWWNLETFTCTLGVISSMICFGVEAARSRSRRRRSRRLSGITSPRDDEVVGMDITTTSPTAVSTRVPVTTNRVHRVSL